MMQILKRGFRKFIITIFAFIWAYIELITVWFLLKNHLEFLAPVLIATYSFESTIVLYMFVSNYGEHREEKLKNNGGE